MIVFIVNSNKYRNNKRISRYFTLVSDEFRIKLMIKLRVDCLRVEFRIDCAN